MTLSDVSMMHRYWRRNPPLRVLVACVAKALGVEFPDLSKANGKEPENKYMTAEELRRMIQATGGRIDGMGQFNG